MDPVACAVSQGALPADLRGAVLRNGPNARSWGSGGGWLDGDGMIHAVVLDEVPAYPEARYLLGFNEPNIVTQSNLTAAEACDQWPLLEAAAAKKNLSLGSPAVNHCHFEPECLRVSQKLGDTPSN